MPFIALVQLGYCDLLSLLGGWPAELRVFVNAPIYPSISSNSSAHAMLSVNLSQQPDPPHSFIWSPRAPPHNKLLQKENQILHCDKCNVLPRTPLDSSCVNQFLEFFLDKISVET